MNNTMVREIRGAKINPKSSFKNYVAQNMRGRKLREQIRYVELPCYLRRTDSIAQMYLTLLLLWTTVTKYNKYKYTHYLFLILCYWQSIPHQHNIRTLYVLLLLFSIICFRRSFDHHQVADTST